MKVVIFQYRLFHYRVDLFERLRAACVARGIQLELVTGQAFGKERLKNDEGELSWAHRVRNVYFPIVEKKDLCWQPMPRGLKDVDLVIFMQENRLIANLFWILRRKLAGGPLVAYWGHGRDFQSRAPGGFRERGKTALIKAVEWWFAYTRITCGILAAAGFPEHRTTCLNNAIDVGGLRRDWEAAPPEVVARIRGECGLADGDVVGLFCGSLYPDKKLDLLVAACDRIRRQVPNFRLVVVGDGASREQLVRDLATRPWAKWVGAQRGQAKAVYFGLATVVLNPGSVGLHVLDAFSMGLPMITTATALHGPEIAYLEHRVNGLATAESADAYAGSVIDLLNDGARLRAMSAAARSSSDRYTLDNMVGNFVAGIEGALALRRDVADRRANATL